MAAHRSFSVKPPITPSLGSVAQAVLHPPPCLLPRQSTAYPTFAAAAKLLKQLLRYRFNQIHFSKTQTLEHGKPVLRSFISGENLVAFFIMEDFKLGKLNLC